MAYEFKKLSDVDVVAKPTESANVLIEENGVIKKAPKTAVGGSNGGSVGYNAVVFVEPQMEGDTPYAASLMSGSFDDLKEIFDDSQNMPKVLVIIDFSNVNGPIAKTESFLCTYAAEEECILFGCIGGDGLSSVKIYPDNETEFVTQ